MKRKDLVKMLEKTKLEESRFGEGHAGGERTSEERETPKKTQ